MLNDLQIIYFEKLSEYIFKTFFFLFSCYSVVQLKLYRPESARLDLPCIPSSQDHLIFSYYKC